MQRADIRQYLKSYCRNGMHYLECKRYLVRQEMGFCPDFVLPDMPDGTDEIIRRFDEMEEE